MYKDSLGGEREFCKSACILRAVCGLIARGDAREKSRRHYRLNKYTLMVSGHCHLFPVQLTDIALSLLLRGSRPML